MCPVPYLFSRSVEYFFTILNILWEDASDGCKLQEVPFIDLQFVDIRLLGYISAVLRKKGAWLWVKEPGD